MPHSEPKPNCRRCGKPKGPGRGRKLCDDCDPIGKTRTTCRDCGGPRPPRKQICDECRELVAWRKKTRARNRKRRPCNGCGGPKEPGKRRRFCDRCMAKRAVQRPCENCHIRPKRYSMAKLCVVCKFEAAERLRERNRERHRQYRADGKAPYRKPSRARQKRINEAHRLSIRMRAEREGAPKPPVPEDRYHKTNGYGGRKDRVPVAPLVPLLSSLLDLEAFADGAGVSVSTVHRIVTGQYTDLRISEADRIYTQLGLPLSMVL